MLAQVLPAGAEGGAEAHTQARSVSLSVALGPASLVSPVNVAESWTRRSLRSQALRLGPLPVWVLPWVPGVGYMYRQWTQASMFVPSPRGPELLWARLQR